MKNLYEVFDEFEEAKSKKDRMNIIEKNLSKVLVDVFKIKKIIIGHDHRFGRNRTATIDDLINFGETYGFEVEQISQELSIEIAKVRHTTRLKMPDACVLALAKSLDAELITADRQLADKSKQLKVKTQLLS